MINIGLIGTNFITEWFVKGANEVENVKINAVYSRREDTAKEFAKKFNIENTFTDLEEMAKSDLIDAVYVASPNSLHAKQAILFLKNKKHAIVEKAFGSNSKEVQEMIDVATENNVVLMEAMKTTMFPNFKLIKENLHKIGTVRKYFASYCQYSSRYDKYKEGEVLNAFKTEFSNGATMDIGVYCIEPMINLFGKPKKVQANGMLLNTGVDGSANVIFEYDTMQGAVIYSKVSNSYITSEIQGEEGSIIIDRINKFEDVKIIYKDGTEEIISKEQKENNMCYEVEEFAKLIENKERESKINSHAVSKNTIEVLDEIRRQLNVIYPAD